MGRRVPTLSRATRNFSEFSASEGQELEVFEQDTTGEFFRVRAVKARKYRDHNEDEETAAVVEGWIRHVYLEWPEEAQGSSVASMPAPRMAPAAENPQLRFAWEAERMALEAARAEAEREQEEHDEARDGASRREEHI